MESRTLGEERKNMMTKSGLRWSHLAVSKEQCTLCTSNTRPHHSAMDCNGLSIGVILIAFPEKVVMSGRL